MAHQQSPLSISSEPADSVPRLLTIGHGAHPGDEFVRLLTSAGIRSLVDIRIAPGSRRHPQFSLDELSRRLPEEGISYRWERRLGGFRRLPADSPDTALTNTSFRAYAAHMRSTEFVAAMAGVVGDASRESTVVMCSESVWWRCHRRLVADHAELLDGLEVVHVMPDGRQSSHRRTDGARIDDGQLVYDVGGPLAAGGQSPLPLRPPC